MKQDMTPAERLFYCIGAIVTFLAFEVVDLGRVRRMTKGKR